MSKLERKIDFAALITVDMANCNGDPLPTFTGEPHRVNIKDDIEEFAGEIWESLNVENKISLYVRYTDIETGKYTDKIINKNGR